MVGILICLGTTQYEFQLNNSSEIPWHVKIGKNRNPGKIDILPEGHAEPSPSFKFDLKTRDEASGFVTKARRATRASGKSRPRDEYPGKSNFVSQSFPISTPQMQF